MVSRSVWTQRAPYVGNVFVERLWRSVKNEEVCLKAYESVVEARAGIGAYPELLNNERPHQALGRRTPAQVFEEGRNQVHQPELSARPGQRRPNNGLER